MKYFLMVLSIFVFSGTVLASESNVSINQVINSQSKTSVSSSVSNKTVVSQSQNTQIDNKVNVQVKSSAGSTGVNVENNIQVTNKNGDTKITVNGQKIESTNSALYVSNNKYGQQRNIIALDRMSAVAQSVQEILNGKDELGGIGEKVREVARNQNQLQSEIKNQFEKLEKRTGFARQFLGPDFGALKKLKNQLEENQKNITEFNKLLLEDQKNDLKSKLDIIVQNMENQQLSLREKINTEEGSPGMLGWLITLFIK